MSRYINGDDVKARPRMVQMKIFSSLIYFDGQVMEPNILISSGFKEI